MKIKYILFLSFLFLNTSFLNGKAIENFNDTISIEYKNGVVLVPVTIDGVSYPFILDTGASRGFVYKSSSFTMHKSDKKYYTMDVNQKTGTLDITQPMEIKIGNYIIPNYQFSIMGGTGFDCFSEGIIGFDMFENVIMKIDVRNNILILTNQKQLFEKEYGIDVKYKTKNSRPAISYNIASSKNDWAIFDTGANLFFQYDINKLKYNPELANQVVWSDTGRTTYSVHGLGDSSKVAFINPRVFAVGDISFNNAHIQAKEGESFLGAKILEYCAVIIDPFSKKIKFEPYSMSKTIEMKGTEKNEVISFVDSKLTIVMINENSKLYKLGARKNDVILEIDGVIVSDICSLLAIKNALSDTSNHKLKMIDLNGNLKMFEIK